jgi:hypothetical protein
MKKVIIYLKTTILLILVLGLPQMVNASPGGIAGPDSTICPGESVTVGAGTKGGCYAWFEGPKLVGSSAKLTVSPTKTTSYTVIYTAPNFTSQESDGVTVYVQDITGVSAVPKVCCFKTGDGFSKDDFTITTSPPNFKKLKDIRFDPSSAPSLVGLCLHDDDNYVSCGVKTKSIKVTAKGCVKEVEANADVIVVDENISKSWALTAESNSWAEGFAKLRTVEAVAKKIARFAPCEPTSSIGVTGTIKFSNLCCPKQGKILSGLTGGSGSAELGLSLECRFPFPWPPLAPFFQLFFSVGAEGALTLGSVEATCEGLKYCCGIGGSIGVAGGLVTNKSFEKVIDARALLEGKVNVAQLNWCSDKGWDDKNGVGWISGEVNLKAEVKFLGSMWKFKYAYCIYKAP